MTGFIVAKKLGQKQVFDENKVRRVVTELSVEPCFVTQLKTPETDGYWAIQIGTATKKPVNVKKPQAGIGKKAGVETPLDFFREIRIDSKLNPEITENEGKKSLKVGENEYTLGMELKTEAVFKSGDKVKVTGISKGKGFAGVVKRHKFAGGPKTHGQSDRLRAPGAISSGTMIGRIFKGLKMAGRMGNEKVTIKGLKVMESAGNKLMVYGVVPGSVSRYLIVANEK